LPTQYGEGGALALANQSADETREQARAKLNIFDEQDSNMLKHETLAKLGFEDKGLV
jgi:Domain of unknown function (DUF4200)